MSVPPIRERVFAGAPATIGRGMLASSFQYYVTGEENLRLEWFTIPPVTSLRLTLRFWDEHSRSIQVTSEDMGDLQTAPTTIRDFKLAAGALLNARLSSDDTVAKHGALFARLSIMRGLGGGITVLGTLLQGYVSSGVDLGWPGSPIESPHSGHGVLTDASWNIGAAPLRAERVVSQRQRWDLVSGMVLLQTSGVAAGRSPLFQVSRAGVPYWQAQFPFTVPAGQVVALVIGPGLAPVYAAVFGVLQLPCPAHLELERPDEILIRIDNAQVGDTLTDFGLMMRQWVEPNAFP